LFLASSLLILVGFHVYRGPLGTIAANLTLAGLGGLLVATPWLITVVMSHGPDPLLSAGRTSLDLRIGVNGLLGLNFTDGSVLDLVTALGVLGVIVRIARGQWMIPLWLVSTFLIDPRAGSTYATVPLALSVVPILGELVQRTGVTHGGPASLDSETLPRLMRRHGAAGVILALLLFVTLRTAARTAVDPAAPLYGLANDHGAAMRWVAANTDEDARFAVLTGRQWESDYLSEWFPVLARRTSVATVQGSEWGGLNGFIDRLAEDHQLQDCADKTVTCLEEWAARWDERRAFALLPKGRLFGPTSSTDCCPALRETLTLSDRWVLLYDGPGASIFAPADVVAAGSPAAGTSR
jgi:hypothetical protein